jgi:drug/metabolite transporter (DMT)-like permease
VRDDTATRSRAGFFYGVVAVLAFSFTLPATRVAVAEMDSVVVGLGRALVAAVLAVAALVATKQRPPARAYWGRLFLTGLGIVIGFPLLSAIALRDLPSAHTAVIVGLLPATTAVMAVLRAGERPSLGFWAAAMSGLVVVLAFAAFEGAGRPHKADLLVLLAVVLGGYGYAEGAALSREIGAWQVICWVLVLIAPVIAVPVLIAVARHGVSASPIAWWAFFYVAVMSMFVGYYLWYKGLALGGVARIAQVQLMQPVLTIIWAGLLLKERVGARTALASLLIVLCVAWTQRARVARVR